MASKPLENMWLGFAAAVLPENCGEVQRIEMRKAFYGGAASFQTLLLRGISDGDGVTQGDEDLMTSLDGELREFGKELDLEVLTRAKGAKA